MIFGSREAKSNTLATEGVSEPSTDLAKAGRSATHNTTGRDTPSEHTQTFSEPNGGETQDKAQIAREALQSKMMSAAFGDVVRVLMRSPSYKHYSLADLEWLVAPGALTGQFALAEARAKNKGFSVPVGVALWARVCDEVDKKLSDNLDKPVRLRPNEWKSGDIFWLIDVIGERRVVGGC